MVNTVKVDIQFDNHNDLWDLKQALREILERGDYSDLVKQYKIYECFETDENMNCVK